MGYVTGSRSWIQSHGSMPLYINELGNNVIINSGTGNVGIGTTNPGAKLDVNGVVNIALGTNSAPSLTFGGDSNTGFYQATADPDTIKVSIGGTQYWNWGGAGFEGGVNGPSIKSDGTTASAPAYSFRSDTNTGMFRSAADAIGFATNGAEAMTINNGNVGIGTTSPSQKLDVQGGNIALAASYVIGSGSGYGCAGCSQSGTIKLYDGSTGDMTIQSGTSYDLALNPSGGNVGIGTTTPRANLSIYTSTNGGDINIGSVSGYNAIWLNNLTGLTEYNLLSQATNTNLYINRPSGKDIFIREGNSNQHIIKASGNVGLGTTAPQDLLNLKGGNLNMSNGTIEDVWKITLNVGGTIDPPYKIDNVTYTTYAPFMVGVKEEVSGLLNLVGNSTVIDFDNLEKGSDLWLFYQITDFGENMENLQIILTPGFDGKVWYKKDPVMNIITIYGSASGEVSYRMTSNRYDSGNWDNIAKEPVGGEGVKEKSKKK
jgi:hypothetical protein